MINIEYKQFTKKSQIYRGGGGVIMVSKIAYFQLILFWNFYLKINLNKLNTFSNQISTSKRNEKPIGPWATSLTRITLSWVEHVSPSKFTSIISHSIPTLITNSPHVKYSAINLCIGLKFLQLAFRIWEPSWAIYKCW